MSLPKSQIVWSSAIGIVTVGLIAGIGTFAKLESINVLLIPGLLLAAIVFQQGIHSDHAYSYLTLSVVIDAIIFGLLALLLIKVRAGKSPKNEGTDA